MIYLLVMETRNPMKRGRKPQWILNLGQIFNQVATTALPMVNVMKPMLTLKTMKIERSGDVEWSVTGDTHCGPKALLIPRNGKTYIPVKYSVKVTCAPKLDDRGFLFDQAQVDVWMKAVSQETTTLSCEALAQHVAERLLKKLHKLDHCEVVTLELTLSPAPHLASITVSY